VPQKFVSEEIVPTDGSFETSSMLRGEPSLPPEFTWRDETLTVGALRRTWRGLKEDRGDTYLKRHYFEFETGDGRVAVVYFERHARRGQPRWFLFTIEGATRR
jgi:hypothetical protein